jgi:predicted kinase
VVTGLAGSGKSTVAKPLADVLDVPLVSKDAIKEALFAAVGAGDFDWASLLSRAAETRRQDRRIACASALSVGRIAVR